MFPQTVRQRDYFFHGLGARGVRNAHGTEFLASYGLLLKTDCVKM